MPEAPHRYLHAFIAEATEHLEQLASELVRIEQEAAGGALWDSIFRRVHSVKGSAATIGLSTIVDIAHAAETLIGKLKAQRARPERTDVDLLLQATDALVREVQHASGTAPVRRGAENDPAALVTRLTNASRALPDATPAPPVPAPLPKAVVDPSIPRLDVFFSLAKSCQAPGARTLIVQRKLKGLGTLLEMEPQPAALMQKKGAVRVTALLATARPIDDVRAAFAGIPEVEEIEVRAAPVPNAPAPLPKPAPAAAAAMVRTIPDLVTDESRIDATVRVRAQALDQLLDQAAEVLHGIARLRESARHLPENVTAPFEAEIDRLRRMARDLHGRVMNARLTPFSSLTERLPRAIRELANRLGKEVELEVQGGGVELDRTVIEALGDPLTHLVRNAVDHGLETPEARRAAGKPACGTVWLSASQRGGSIVIEVRDDGRGLDRSRILAKAAQRGMAIAPDAPDREVWQLIFEPGFSTVDTVTDVSGRGVGMDVVRRNIHVLGGRVDLASKAGEGMSVTVSVPLTLAIIDAMTVGANGKTYVLPLASVVESLKVEPAKLRSIAGHGRTLRVREDYLPVHQLGKSESIAVVVESEGTRAALLVDELIGQQQVVVKSLETNFRKVPGISAATIMGDGRVALILDTAHIVNRQGEGAWQPS